VIHQFHPCHDLLWASASLLVQEEAQLVEDVNSTHAKLGTVANLHYVRSGRQSTPTLLSQHQIAYLCKKKKYCVQKGQANKATNDGPIDGIYK
jgi:hypothetical protein